MSRDVVLREERVGLWREVTRSELGAEFARTERAAALATAAGMRAGENVLIARALTAPAARVAVAACVCAGAVAHRPASAEAARRLAPDLIVLDAATMVRLYREAGDEIEAARGLGGRLLRDACAGTGWYAGAVRRRIRRRHGWSRLRALVVLGAAPDGPAERWFAALGIETSREVNS